MSRRPDEPSWFAAASETAQENLETLRLAWEKYSVAERHFLRGAIASGRQSVESARKNALEARVNIERTVDATSAQLGNMAHRALDAVSSTAGAIADGARADLPKRYEMARSAYADYSAKEERAIKGGIASARGAVASVSAEVHAAQKRVQHTADTGAAHLSMTTERGREAVTGFVQAYPESRVLAATLVFCRVLGMLPGNGTWLGRSPRLAFLFALGASVQQSDHLQAKWGAPVGQASEACSARLLALCSAAGLLSPLTTESPFTGTLYLTLDAAAVGCELVAVFVAQQLLYRLYDGTFGVPKGEEGQAASVLGLLVSMHRLEFRTVRLSFISGIVCLLACTIIRAWASFGAERALPVTVTMMTAGATMAYFALRSQQQVFNDL